MKNKVKFIRTIPPRSTFDRIWRNIELHLNDWEILKKHPIYKN